MEIKRSVDNMFEKQKYFFLYTVMFCLLAIMVVGYFSSMGKCFIWKYDGWDQHYKALLYYSHWLREIARSFWETHTLSLPAYSFSIGYGADILTTLHWYVIGDPLNLLSAFVPTKYMPYFYGFLIFLRLYLAGVCFSLFCFYRGHSNRIAVMSGALIYIFSSYALYTSIRHPFWANPMIYLPLLLLGVEKILQEKKPWIFIFSVFIAGVSNFYYFYMLVLMTVLYVMLRIIATYQKTGIKQAVVKIFQIGCYAVIGVMLSAVVLLPVLLLFFNDARHGVNYETGVLYPLSYYRDLMQNFLSYGAIDEDSYIGQGAMAGLAILFLFIKNKKNTALKYAVLLLTAALLFPVGGYIFNGFSFVYNRWIWGYNMLTAYILAAVWHDILSIERKEYFCIISVLSAYLCVCIAFHFAVSLSMLLQLSVIFLVSTVLCLVHMDKRGGQTIKKQEFFMLGGVVCGIILNVYFIYSWRQDNVTEKYMSYEEVEEKTAHTDAAVIASLRCNDVFVRYSGINVKKNASMFVGLSSTQFYWSLTSKDIGDYFEEMGLPEILSFKYEGLDSRAILLSLAGVKYFEIPDDSKNTVFVPFGFQEITKEEQWIIYENPYCLPLGYVYDRYIPQEEYASMNSAERQEALLQGAVIDQALPEYEMAEVVHDCRELPFTIEYNSDDISKRGNSFVVTKNNVSINLIFDGSRNAETYLCVNGLDYEGFSELYLYNDDERADPLNRYTTQDWKELDRYEQKVMAFDDLYWEEPNGFTLNVEAFIGEEFLISKDIRYYTPGDRFYGGRDDFLLNLGYSDAGKTRIVITFPKIGIYSYDELSVICQSLEHYPEQIELLRKESLTGIDLHNHNEAASTNLVTGTITLQKPGILCISIPYSSGWSACVDGEQKNLLRANTMFMALPLNEGKHSVKLIYHTPGLRMGGMLTCVGAALVCILMTLDRLKKKTKADNKCK